MTHKKYISKERDEKELDSTASTTSKFKVSFYSGFEDMERSKIEYSQQTDPVTRIKNVVDLIRQIYGEEKCLPGTNPKILYFKE
ncbi:MAG: hypothetical protein WAT79_09630 [Saprospiraceae bacterium]